jgi:hypothetical protein
MAKDKPNGTRPSGWYHEHTEQQQPEQHPDKQDHHRHANYHNDVGNREWTRGAPGVDPYPHFDHSDKAPRFNNNKGNNWTSNRRGASHEPSEVKPVSHYNGEGPIAKSKRYDR